MLSEDEFIEYYNTYHKLPNGMLSTGKRPLNEKELKTRYKKYCKLIKKQEQKFNSIIEDEDSEYISDYIKNQKEAKRIARELDPHAEVFFSKLTEDETTLVKNMMKLSKDFAIIDPAHIFSTGTTPQLADCVENILMLPRCVHHYIDNYLNPLTITHEAITQEQRNEFWIRFIGIDRWNNLLELKRNI
jgi:hypothetical protein